MNFPAFGPKFFLGFAYADSAGRLMFPAQGRQASGPLYSKVGEREQSAIEAFINTFSFMFGTNQNTPRALQHKLHVLLRTGKLLVGAAADTSRIMRNMSRTAAYLGLQEENLQINIDYNMLMVNLTDGEHSYCQFMRCKKHGIDMTAIEAVSRLTWQAIKADYSVERFEEELDRIEGRRRNYTPWQVAVGAGVACGGFCVQFGGDWPSFLYASVAAMLGFRLRQIMNEKGSNDYLNIAVAAFLSTIVAWLFAQVSVNLAVTDRLPGALRGVLVSETPWHPLMACALFIVPGVPLINFVNDMLNSYVQVGITRAVNTLLMVLAMSFGIAFAISFCGIDNFVKTLSMTPHHEYWEFATAAAISAMGFSMIFNIPRRLLWAVAVGGVLAVCTRNFVSLGASNGNIGLDYGPIIGSFVGSAFVSIVCTRAMHWLHTPHHCLSIPSVIPMIPGVLMYRALFALIDMHGVVGEVTVAMNNGIRASLMILFISVGVAIPNIFVRRMTQPSSHRRLLDLLVERKRRHGEFVDLTEVEQNNG